MGSAVLTNAVATSVSQQAPTTNYDSKSGLMHRTGGGGDLFSMIYWPRPFPLKATILSAQIVWYTTGMAEAVTHTFTFQRLAQGFPASKVTWNTRPTALQAGTKTATKTGTLASGTQWTLDVTDWCQAIANGGAWYGIKVTLNEAIRRDWFAENHPTTTLRPRLEVTWSDAPSIPTNLAPAGGRKVGVAKPVLRASYLDVSGSTALQAAQVQVNATDVWTAPSFDTGTYLTATPDVPLANGFARSAPGTIGITNASTSITASVATFDSGDIGASIVGSGIPVGATITAVASATAATISAAATATAAIVATITRNYAGLADGGTTFWRIRFQDAAGLWSPWSASASFTRDDKGTFTVSSPSSGTPTVEDATPVIIWTLTGETQAAYQIQITHVANNARITDWDSGKITSTATSVTVPAGKINEPSSTVYTLTVRVWDNEAREATPGDPVYSEIVRDFTFVPGATAAVTSLAAAAGDPRPKVTLTWNRSVAPDRFNILRNGRVIAAALDPVDLLISGTQYGYTDNSPSPGRSLTYSVQAVVNNIASGTNPTAVVTVRSKGIWLREPVSGLEVCIAGKEDNRSFTLGESSATLQSIAPNANKVAINQSLGGLEGRIEGNLESIFGRTAQQWRDDLLKMRALRVKRFWLTVGDYTFSVVCQNFSYGFQPTPAARFRVGFDFYQQDSISSAYLGS